MTKNTMKKLTALILSLSLMLGALPLQLNAADEYVPTESIVHDYGFDYPEAPAPEAPDYIIEDEIVDEEIVEDETVDEEIVEDEIIDEEIVEDEIIDEEIVEDETVDEEKVDDEIIDEEDVDDEIVNDEDINGNIYDEEFEDEVEYEVNEAEEARFNFIHGQILDEYTGMPIAGAIVELWDSYGALMYAVTGEFGFYILDVSGFYIENIYTYMLMADAYGFGFAWVMLAEIIADTCADGFLTWNAQLAPTVEELVVPLNIINGNVGVDGLGTPGAPWTLDTITGILRVGGGVLYDFGGPGCISGFGTIYNRGLHGWDWETNNGAGVWHDFGEYITEIHFDEAVTIYRTQSGSGDWLIWPFSGLPNLTLISGLENIDVSTVEHTEWIFGELGYIELRGIENWDVSNFGSTSHMFVSTHFSNLIDLSLWETQNWSSIERLFQQTINVPFGIENWDTSSVMQAGHMFSGAVILDEYGQPRALDLTGWDVSNNYWKNNMFSGTVVQSVDLRGWNTSRIANMNHMFSGMVDLVTRLGDFPLDELIARDFIDIVAIPEFGYMQIARAKTLTSIYGINDLDVSNVEHMNGMFAFSVLESIDLSDWNVGNVADFSLMFLRSNITTVGDISDWDTSNAETMQMMFAGSAFTHLDLSNWTPSEDMMMMFANMEELEYLNLSNWDTSDLIGTGAMWAMLNGANALATLVLGEDTYLEGVDLREGYWRQTAGASVGTILSSEDLLYYEGVPTTNPGTWVWQATNEPGEQPIQTGTIGYRPGAAPWRLYADGRLVIEGGEIQTGGTGNNRGISNPTDIFYGSTYAHPWHDVPYNYLINEIIITGELFVNPETNSSLYILDTSDTTTLMLLFGSWGTTCDGFGTADITITGLNYINTEGVVRMSDMFPFFGAATLDGIEGWDTSSARYMGSLFLMMPNLTSLDLSDWVVDNVTDMHGMFAFTDRLTTVGDISGWNIGNVVNMEAMFAFAHSITHLDLSGWNLASAEKMNMMFMDMVSLEYLNLSGWDTSNLLGTEMMYGMMQGANALATLVLGEDTYLEGVSLRSGYWRQIDGPSVGTVLSSHDLLYAEGGIPRTNPGTWAWQATNEGSVPVATGTVGYEGAPWRLYEDGTLIVSEGTLRDSSSNAEINNWGIFHGSVATGGSFFGPWYNFKDYITSIHFEGAVTRSGSGVHGGELNRMFADLTNVHTISGLENFNLGNVERMAGMFENIGSVELQGIEAWNVSNVARMNGMFAGVYFATNLDLSNWNTGNVGNFSAMFHSAFNVPHGVQYWDVSYAWDMGAMFAGAVFLDWNSEYLALLPHLDLSGWQLSDLLGQWLGEGFGSGGLAAMFMGTAVQSLDLTGWDAGLATDISFDAIFGDVNTLAMIPTDHFHFDDMVALGFTFMETPIMPGAVLMFTNALTNIYGIAAWDTSEVLSMSGAFAGTSLNSLDLSNWDTGLVTNMSMMFTYAGQLTTVGDIYAWDVSGVYDMHLMFYASALTELDLSGWDVRNVNNMLMMFAAMSDLEYLNLSGWDTSGTVDTSGMLQGANALATLVLGEDTYLEGVSLRGGYWRQIAGTSVGTVLSSEDLLYNEGVPITNPGTWAWQATNEPPEQPIQTGTIGNRPGAAPWRLYADGTLYILSGEIQTGGFGFNRGVGRCPSGGTLLAAVNPWHNLPTTYTFNRIVITGPLTVNSATNDGMTLVAMFADLPSSVMRISGLEHIDLYGVINIMEMFGGFRGTHLDGIGAWDVSTVQIMASMFADTAVTSLDISGWDVSSVTNMESMFVVANVTGLDLSGWDVSNVTSMINMFLGTNALTTLNVSTWDLSSVTNMQSMFNNTNALAVLDISGWDTRTVSNMSAMFIGMNALRTIVLGPYTVLQPNAGLPAVSNTVPFLGNWIKAGGPGATPALGATRTSAGTAGIGLMSASPNPGTWVWNDGSPIPLITGTVGPGGAPWRLYDDGTLRIAEGEFRWNNNAPVGGVNNRGISLNVSPWYEFRADITSIVIEGDITVTARVGGVGTGAVTLQYLFANLHNVTNITGLERIINISNVEVMASVFNSAIGLTSLDLSGWDTSSATHMNGMFWGASGLTSLNISGWDTSSVTRMNGMFGNTSGLTSLDLSGWDTSNVTDMFMMFESPPGLKLSTLILGPEFHFIGGTPAGTEAGLPAVPTTGEFNGHWTDGTRFVTSAELMQLQAPATAGTWVWATGDLPVATGTVGIGGAPWRIYADGTLIVSTGELRTGGGPSNAGTGGNSYNRGINTTAGNIGGRDIVSPWHDFREYFTEIQFIGEITVQSVLMGLFAYLTDVTVISGLENIETEGVYDMGSMFYRSGHFYEVQGLEDWDVSYVTGMIYMFAYAIFTNAPDLSKWDTASLTSTEQMFVFTYNVPHGIMNWNTENVTRMADMFLGAAFIEQDSLSPLALLDLTGWDVGNVVSMFNVFRGTVVTAIDVTGWQLDSVYTTSYMFMSIINDTDLSFFNEDSHPYLDNLIYIGGGVRYWYEWDDSQEIWISTALTAIYGLEGWDMENVSFMQGMFVATRLTELELTSWRTTSAEDIGLYAMFAWATELTTVGDLSGWDISGVNNLVIMFADTVNLTYVGDISAWDVSDVYEMMMMFAGSGITHLDLSGWDVTNVDSMFAMFQGMEDLVYLNLSGWDTEHLLGDGMMTDMLHGADALATIVLGEDTYLEGVSLRDGYWRQTAGENIGKELSSFALLYAEVGVPTVNPGTWNWIEIELYTLTVFNPGAEGGTESGEIASGTVVTLDHGTRTDGYVFAGWTSDAVSLVVNTFTMPAADVIVEAVWIHEDDILAQGSIGNRINAAPWTITNCGILHIFGGEIQMNVAVDSVIDVNRRGVGRNNTGTDHDPFTTAVSPWFSFAPENINTISIHDDLFVEEARNEYMSLGGMFSNFTNTDTAINGLEHINTMGVRTLSRIFANFGGPLVSGIEFWDVSEVTMMNSVFFNANALTALDLSEWDVSNVTSLDSMFANATSLVVVNLTGWDTTSEPLRGFMFSQTVSLRQLMLGPDTLLAWSGAGGNLPEAAQHSGGSFVRLPQYTGYWVQTDPDAATPVGETRNSGTVVGAGLLSGASNPGTWEWQTNPEFLLTIINPDAEDGTESGYVVAGTVVTLDHGTRTGGYVFAGWTSDDVPVFIDTFAMPAEDATVTAVWIHEDDIAIYGTVGPHGAPWFLLNNGTLRLFSGWLNQGGSDAERNHGMSQNRSPWHPHHELITNIIIEGNVEVGNASYYLANMFNFLSRVTTINGLDRIRTDNVRNMRSMFAFNAALTTLDVSGFDVSNVTDMSNMFSGAHALRALDVSDWDVTSNVTNMNQMFSNTWVLATLDVSGWDVSNVTNMNNMFMNMYALTTLDVSNWNVSSVTNMRQMFINVNTLTVLDVSNWNISNVTNMENMFSEMFALQSLDFSGWDTHNNLNMSNMLANTRSLSSLSLGENITLAANAGLLTAAQHLPVAANPQYTGWWVDADNAEDMRIASEIMGYTFDEDVTWIWQ
ncbi:MAG: BspA family leucine-rich repeat surface protein, partial [Defluviitaleaceae bacterium]|nr:BspA family leucine-rich repeat surface protein [Defluviitaleaceae bacterium]